MWYPEEPVTYCRYCDLDIPTDCFWRGRGFIISGGGGQERTAILYSVCPECGRRLSMGLEGPWWFRLLYGWLWKLRYPGTAPPELDLPAAEAYKRRVFRG